MTKNKNEHKRNKNIVRSTLSGKIVNGREVILTSEAIEYCLKMNYTLMPNKIMNKPALISCFLFLLSLMFFLVPTISAFPPFQTGSSNVGIDVAGVDFTKVFTFTNRTAVANIFNSSNGLPLNSGVNCQFQVFDVENNGTLLFQNNTPKIVNNTFYFGIPNNVYVKEREYTRIIQCNSSTQGGFYKSTFDAINFPYRSQSSLLNIDFTTLKGIIILIIFCLVTLALYSLKSFGLSGITLVILGILALLNDLGILISIVIISLGGLIATKNGSN